MTKQKKILFFVFSSLFSSLFFILLYFIIIKYKILTDIQGHANFVYIRAIDQGKHSNFVFYYLARIFSLFSKDSQNILVGTLVLISVSMGFKSYLTLRYIDNREMNLFVILCMGVAVLLYYPFFGVPPFYNHFFRGLIKPNIYHNSTMLVSMPFVIFIYTTIVKAIENQFKQLNLYYFALASFCISFIKISFLFALIPALSLYLLHLLINRKAINYRLLFVILISVIFVSLVYLQVFLFGANKEISGYDAKVVFAPFRFWNYESNNLLLTIVNSLAYPLFFILYNYKNVFKNSSLVFSLVLVIISFLVTLLFCESGVCFSHGNLTWQLHICTYLLIMEVVKHHISNFKNINKYGNIILLTILLGHFLMGIKYIKWIFALNAWT